MLFSSSALREPVALRRGENGRYETTAAGGEAVRAFIPGSLPPTPPLVLEAGLERALEAAVLAVGRLDGVSTLLPDKALFLYRGTGTRRTDHGRGSGFG
jgi:hypothetical protein